MAFSFRPTLRSVYAGVREVDIVEEPASSFPTPPPSQPGSSSLSLPAVLSAKSPDELGGVQRITLTLPARPQGRTRAAELMLRNIGILEAGSTSSSSKVQSEPVAFRIILPAQQHYHSPPSAGITSQPNEVLDDGMDVDEEDEIGRMVLDGIRDSQDPHGEKNDLQQHGEQGGDAESSNELGIHQRQPAFQVDESPTSTRHQEPPMLSRYWHSQRPNHSWSVYSSANLTNNGIDSRSPFPEVPPKRYSSVTTSIVESDSEGVRGSRAVLRSRRAPFPIFLSKPKRLSDSQHDGDSEYLEARDLDFESDTDGASTSTGISTNKREKLWPRHTCTPKWHTPTQIRCTVCGRYLPRKPKSPIPATKRRIIRVSKAVQTSKVKESGEGSTADPAQRFGSSFEHTLGLKILEERVHFYEKYKEAERQVGILVQNYLAIQEDLADLRAACQRKDATILKLRGLRKTRRPTGKCDLS